MISLIASPEQIIIDNIVYITLTIDDEVNNKFYQGLFINLIVKKVGTENSIPTYRFRYNGEPLVWEINKYTYELYPDMEDYLMETDKLFDESIYDKNRKLRSLYCSKPDENRPLNLYQGTFNQSIISCFIPKDAQSIEMNKPQPLPSVIPV